MRTARRSLLLASLLLSLLSTSLFAQTLTVRVPQGNVRAGPGTTHEVVGTVKRGEKYQAREQQGDWFKILLESGREGWVLKSLVEVSGRRTIGVVPSPPRPASELYGQSFAVVIGVSAYQNPSLRLHYAVNDAESVRAALRRLGFPASNILYLTDGRATGRAIRTAFNGLIQRTSPKDRVFFFFAGHGVTLDRPGGGQMGYLLPVEADPGNIVGTGVPMSEVRDLAGLLPAKHVFFAVDACFSGLLAARSVPRPETRADPAYLARGRLRQVLTAGERDQPVLEEGGHGLFTKRLLEALEGEADQSPRDGVLTAMEVAAFVQGRVMASSNSRQTPFFGTMEGVGQFVFSAPGLGRAGIPPRPSPTPPPVATPPPPSVTSVPLGKGDLYVSTDPPAAIIIVDGRNTGKKTPHLLAELPAGAHRIEVRKGEELAASQEVFVKPGDLTRLNLRLEHLQGELYATVQPFGAEVWVDGKKVGETPLKRQFPAGEREVGVRKKGYYPLKEKVSVRFGQTARVTGTLREIPPDALALMNLREGASRALLSVRKEAERRNTIYLPDVVRAQARLGDVDAARETIQAYQRKPKLSGTDLLNIAKSQYDIGDSAGALETVRKNPDAEAYDISGRRSQVRHGFIRHILDAQRRSGNRATYGPTIALALKAARLPAEKDKPPASSLRDVAVAQAEAGDFSGALGTAAMIPLGDSFVSIRAEAFQKIAALQAKGGDKEAAKRTFALAVEAASKVFYLSRVESLTSVGVSQADSGLADSARETFGLALKFETDWFKSRAVNNDTYIGKVAWIARKAAEAGLDGIAQTAIRRLEGEGDLESFLCATTCALRDLAVALAHLGDFNRALDTARRIRKKNDRDARAAALVEIAKAQIRAGRREAAWAALREATPLVKGQSGDFEGWFRVQMLEAGMVHDAVQAAIQDETSPIWGYNSYFNLKGLVDRQAEIADKATARQLFASVLAVASRFKRVDGEEKGGRREDAIKRFVAEAQAKIGDIDDAIRTLNSTRYPDSGATPVYIAIAETQAKAGDRAAARKSLEKALELDEQSGRDSADPRYLLRIATVYAMLAR